MGIYRFCHECGKAVEVFLDELDKEGNDILCEKCEYEQFEDDLIYGSMTAMEEAAYMQDEF